MISIVRRNSLARLSAAVPSQSPSYAHTYTHLAAAPKTSLRGLNHRSYRTTLDAFNPSGVAYYYALSSSFAPIREAPIASSSKTGGNEDVMRDRPPMVIPEDPSSRPGSSSTRSDERDGKPVLSPDAASPQIAARPPRPPKAEKAKPRLVGRKAAISLVRIVHL